MFSILLGIGGSYGSSMFTFVRNYQIVFQWLFHFTFALAVYGSSSFSASLPTLAILCLFYHSHCSGRVVIFQCGFELHFSSH